MRESLQRLCDSFIENRDIIKGAFRFENSAMYAVCANIFTARGQTADLDRLDMCKQLIKEKTGIFSNFRGVVRMPIICMLAAQDNPSSLMEETLSCYEELKGHFFSSSYLALVAFLMADLNDGNAADRAARGRAIYKRMSKEHPFLTSSEDSVFAVLLAYSEKSDDQLIEDMEKCYDLLRSHFHASNYLQAASHVLAMSDHLPEEKADRLGALYEEIRAAGGKFDRNDLATLAAVSITDADIHAICQDMMEVDTFLATQKGYGMLGITRSKRMAHAAMIVSNEYAPRGPVVDAASVSSTIAMIAAQEAAMCAVIISTSVSSANTAAHSN